MKSRKLRAVTYSRVSTADKQNPEAQAIELRRYCDAREWQVVEEITDRGFSGGTGPDQRPGLKHLLTLARARSVDVIVVVKLDRLFRSVKHLVGVLDELQALGVLFVSTGDQIDLTTASGRLMMQIIGAFSEFERSLIRERTIRGLEFARSRGRKLGRPSNRPDAEILRLRSLGQTYTQIQNRLGVSRPSIRRAILANQGGTKSSRNQVEKDQPIQGPKK
jgi:DNA invertase Pin-like site-specific DNA recombinase